MYLSIKTHENVTTEKKNIKTPLWIKAFKINFVWEQKSFSNCSSSGSLCFPSIHSSIHSLFHFCHYLPFYHLCYLFTPLSPFYCFNIFPLGISICCLTMHCSYFDLTILFAIPLVWSFSDRRRYTLEPEAMSVSSLQWIIMNRGLLSFLFHCDPILSICQRKSLNEHNYYCFCLFAWRQLKNFVLLIYSFSC